MSGIQAAEDCFFEVFAHFVGASYGLMVQGGTLKAAFVSCVANRERETHIVGT